MGKFTPGPWAVDPDIDVSVDADDPDNGQLASGWVTVRSETHAGFAAIVVDMNSPNQWDEETMDANAALIAAAPELLAALVALSEGIGAASLARNPYGIELRAKAAAAIAKALGQ